MHFQISFYLDTRRPKKDGSYPVKLRVWNNRLRRAKFYPVGIDMDESSFQRTWETDRPRSEFKEQRIRLNAYLSRAEEIAKGLEPFTFEAFERKFQRKSSDADNVYWHYEQMINVLNERKQLGNASNYRLSMRSIQGYLLYKNGRPSSRLTFFEITPGFLESYENHMTEAGKSRTTVSMYLRALRAIFNEAISKEDIQAEIYPFGKRKYQVPAVTKVKKALDKTQLKLLWEAIPQSSEQEKAKDFWFFSFAANGMNIKDIVQLKFKDLHGDKFVFYRAKTINTTKSNSKQVQVYLNDYLRSVIEKYRVSKNANENYIFPILKKQESAEKQRSLIQNFTRFINQHIKLLAKANGITDEISTYWARHSFATTSVLKGASMAFVQESLGHGSIKTTMGYFAGFGEESKKDFAATLMEF